MTEEQYFDGYIIREGIMIRDESHELCIRAFAPYLYSFCGKRAALPELFSKLCGIQPAGYEENFNCKRGDSPPYFCDLLIRWSGGAKSYVYYINGDKDFRRLDEAIELGLAGDVLAVYAENADTSELIGYLSEHKIRFVAAEKL